LVVSKGYSFIPVYGGFIENQGSPNETEVREPALLIPNHKVGSIKSHDSDGLIELGVEIVNIYNQDSFLYKPGGGNNDAHYIDKNGDIVMSFKNKTINDLTRTFFTDLSKRFSDNGKTTKRFTFTENIYLNKSPKDLNEAKSRYGEQFFKI